MRRSAFLIIALLATTFANACSAPATHSHGTKQGEVGTIGFALREVGSYKQFTVEGKAAGTIIVVCKIEPWSRDATYSAVTVEATGTTAYQASATLSGGTSARGITDTPATSVDIVEIPLRDGTFKKVASILQPTTLLVFALKNEELAQASVSVTVQQAQSCED